jgi:hypothetical protein
MGNQTFTFINDSRICEIIESAQNHMIYAAPSLSKAVAEALLNFAGRKKDGFRIIVDADAEPFQLGFGNFKGIELLNQNNIEIRKAKGLRIAVLVADELAWVYSPTPEIIFSQPDDQINNAVSVSKDFAQQILVSIAPEFNINADILDTSVLPNSSIPEIGVEVFETENLKEIKQELEINPPQQFDAKRKVRVYEGHFQFVEIQLSGCQIGSHKISIPKTLLNIAKTPDLKNRIKTTFQLVNEDSVVLNKFDAISDAVNELRDNYTDSLGRFGRIIQRKIRNKFDNRVEEIRKEIKVLQQTVNSELSAEILSSHEKLVVVLLPGIKVNPPPVLEKRAFFGEIDDDLAREFILEELDRVTPKTENLIKEMQLNCDYKNITYEMLNDKEFVSKVKEKYPKLEKLYEEDEAIKVKQS